MKIAVPTNDRSTIALRTGRAKEFAIYEILDHKKTSVVYKKNTHKHDHKHGDSEEHEHSHKEIIDLLKGIDLLIVRAIGKHFKHDVEETQIKYIKTRKEDINDILKEYTAG